MSSRSSLVQNRNKPVIKCVGARTLTPHYKDRDHDRIKEDTISMYTEILTFSIAREDHNCPEIWGY